MISAGDSQGIPLPFLLIGIQLSKLFFSYSQKLLKLPRAIKVLVMSCNAA